MHTQTPKVDITRITAATVSAMAMELVADLVDEESGFTISEAWAGERDGWLSPAAVAHIETSAIAAFLRRAGVSDCTQR